MDFYNIQDQIYKVVEGSYKALTPIYIGFVESTSISIEGLWLIDGFL